MTLAALAAAASLSNCTPVPGADQLWADADTKYVLLGEHHGTNEAPALFADLVCAASAKRKVIVALEHPPENQPEIDAFLQSNGDAAARSAFLESLIWSNARDGRNSVAMLNLYEQLRQWTSTGRIKAVVAFSAYDLSVPFSNANEGANRGMAQVLERTAAAYPDAVVLGYGGSVHMSVHDVWGTTIRSAAGRLPRAKLISAFIEGDTGSAWSCLNDACGVHKLEAFGPHHPRGVRKAQEYPLPGFDFIVSTGTPFSASLPAIPLRSVESASPPK